MRTWLLNSKKCLTAKRSLSVAGAIALALSWSAQASVPSSISASILNDIHHSHSGSFDSLLSGWEKHYGTSAVAALMNIARDRGQADPDRYVALMGAAKIGGSTSAPLLSPLLKDSSWMIRSGTLRALAALNNFQTAPSVLPLLSDRALVVRLEAVQTIEKLRPNGFAVALVDAVRSPENYHAGHAQWVPQHALEALQRLGSQGLLTASESREAASKLQALLANPRSYQRDTTLKPEIEATLRSLTQR